MRCDYSHNTLFLISPKLFLSTMILCSHGWVGTYIPPSYMPLGNGICTLELVKCWLHTISQQQHTPLIQLLGSRYGF